MIQSTCERQIGHLHCNPPACHEQPEQTGDVAVVTDEEKTMWLAMVAPMMSPSHHPRTAYETDDQTSSTCFHGPTGVNQMIAFEDETQSNQQQLRLDPCCVHRVQVILLQH